MPFLQIEYEGEAEGVWGEEEVEEGGRGRRYQLVCEARRNTWSQQRKRRRLKQRLEQAREANQHSGEPSCLPANTIPIKFYWALLMCLSGEEPLAIRNLRPQYDLQPITSRECPNEPCSARKRPR